MWIFKNKKYEQQDRLIAAQEEANRIEADKLRVEKRKAELYAQVIAMMSQQEQKDPVGYQLPNIPEGVVPSGKTPAIAMVAALVLRHMRILIHSFTALSLDIQSWRGWRNQAITDASPKQPQTK